MNGQVTGGIEVISPQTEELWRRGRAGESQVVLAQRDGEEEEVSSFQRPEDETKAVDIEPPLLLCLARKPSLVLLYIATRIPEIFSSYCQSSRYFPVPDFISHKLLPFSRPPSSASSTLFPASSRVGARFSPCKRYSRLEYRLGPRLGDGLSPSA